jgi:glycosyltransferase involved in cell wall biosynthesis
VVRAHEHLPLSALARAVRFVLARSAGAVVAVSQDTALRFNEGLDHPLATHVYNSFDRVRFNPARVAPAPIREELGIAPGAVLLGQVAQITPWKGQDTAIRAVARLRRDGLDAHVLLVGGIAFAGKGVRYDNHGFLRELHRLVDELGVREAVHFLGQRPDVPGILRALDLSLLPSWSEPFANVMLESMAMGTPVLVSTEGGGPELIEDGVSGRLVPPRRPEDWADAVRELISDPEGLARMGDHARAATRRFRDEVHARDMLRVYEQVLAPAARRPATGALTVARQPEEPAEAAHG